MKIKKYEHFLNENILDSETGKFKTEEEPLKNYLQSKFNKYERLLQSYERIINSISILNDNKLYNIEISEESTEEDSRGVNIMVLVIEIDKEYEDLEDFIENSQEKKELENSLEYLIIPDEVGSFKSESGKTRLELFINLNSI